MGFLVFLEDSALSMIKGIFVHSFSLNSQASGNRGVEASNRSSGGFVAWLCTYIQTSFDYH